MEAATVAVVLDAKRGLEFVDFEKLLLRGAGAECSSDEQARIRPLGWRRHRLGAARDILVAVPADHDNGASRLRCPGCRVAADLLVLITAWPTSARPALEHTRGQHERAGNRN